MTEFKMNLNFEGEQPLENFDTSGRTVFEVSTDSVKAPRFSYENDLSEYPSDICSKFASNPILYYNGAVNTAHFTVDPWRQIVISTEFLAMTAPVKYVRFDVKVLVRVISTPDTYGVIVVGSCPVSLPADLAGLNGDPYLIDAAKGDTTEIILPWEVPYEFYDLSHSMNIGSLRVDGYGFKTQSTSQLPFMQISFMPINIRAKGTRASFQGDVGDPNIIRRYPAASFLAGISGLMSAAKYGTDYVRGVSEDAHQAYRTATEIYDETKPYLEKLKWRDMAEQNSPDPISNVPNVYGNLSTFDYVPANSVTRPHMDMVKPYHLGDINQMHTIMEIASIPCIRDLYQSAAVGSVKAFNLEPGIMDPTKNFVTYLDMMSRFFRYWRGSIELNFCIYMPVLSTAKFRFFFRNCEAYTSASVNPTATDDVWAFSKEFTMKGSGVMSVRLPYISSTQWTRTGLVNDAKAFLKMWEVGLMLQRTSYTGDTAMLPLIVVLTRPGPDFQFKSEASCNTVASAQMRVRTEFENPIEEWGMGQPKKYRIIPEDTLTLEALCNRWSSRVITQNHLSNTTAGVGYKQMDNLDYIMSMFAYQRGSVRWLTHTGGTSTSPVVYMGSGSFGYTPSLRTFANPAGRGVVVGDPDTNPITKFETVWDSSLEWGLTALFVDNLISVDPNFNDFEWYGSQIIIANFAEQSTFAYAAAGRGFQLARLLPPVIAANFKF